MKVEFYNIREGEKLALFGVGLSYGLTSKITPASLNTKSELYAKLYKIGEKLAKKGEEECKFLRAINVTMDITAPMYWWKQFDTYKIATVTQSESTMHTLMKNPITEDCFEGPILSTLVSQMEDLRTRGEFKMLVRCLPMAFLQRRIIRTNYQVLRNIIKQRRNHKLPEWHYFVKRAYGKCVKEWLPPKEEKAWPRLDKTFKE